MHLVIQTYSVNIKENCLTKKSSSIKVPFTAPTLTSPDLTLL